MWVEIERYLLPYFRRSEVVFGLFDRALTRLAFQRILYLFLAFHLSLALLLQLGVQRLLLNRILNIEVHELLEFDLSLPYGYAGRREILLDGRASFLC